MKKSMIVKPLKKQTKNKWYDIIYIELDGVRIYTRSKTTNKTDHIRNCKHEN